MSERSRMVDDVASSITIPVIYEKMDAEGNGKENLIEIIDGIERQVEIVRTQAAYLEEEKDGIITALDSLRQSTYVDSLNEEEKEEVLYNLERLTTRVCTVDVSVNISRDTVQEDALSEVNNLITRVVKDMEKDVHQAKMQCYQFLNACVSDPESGPVDKTFETALLGCTLDDQKRIRKRLRGLMTYIEKMSVTIV